MSDGGNDEKHRGGKKRTRVEVEMVRGAETDEREMVPLFLPPRCWGRTAPKTERRL